MDAELGEVLLPARRVSAPSTISDEAKATLAIRPPRMDDTPPDPADKDGWRQFVAHNETRNSVQLAQLAQRHPCHLEAHTLGTADIYQLTPRNIAPGAEDCAILYLHPGGYTFCAGMNAANIATPLADKLGIVTFALDYRMPPDHPFPAALDDALEAYRFLLGSRPATKIMIAGRSAGGGLAAALLLKARGLGLPMPAACVLQTPQVDLTEAGDSFVTNDGLDNFLSRLTSAIALYADGHDLRDPLLSPVYANFRPGFAPTILTSGTRDLFLSNTVLMHRALRRGGIEAELHVWEAMGHGGFMGLAPEDEEVWEELRCFTRRNFELAG